jgi:hypothetical protein
MKHLLCCVVIVFASIFYLNPPVASAGVILDPAAPSQAYVPQIPPVEFLDRIKTEVAKGTKDLQQHLDNIDKVTYYKDWEAKDATTGKTKHISDLNDKQLRGFFIYQAEMFHIDLSEITANWKEGVSGLRTLVPAEKKPDDKKPKDAPKANDKKIKDDSKKDEPKKVEPKKAEAKPRDPVQALKETIETVDKAIKDVTEIHKRLAVKREAMIEDMIALYKDKDKTLAKELTEYLEKVKAENDEQGLVDRKLPKQEKGKK